MTERALKVLRSGKADAYDKAIPVLREDTRDWWKEKLTWVRGCWLTRLPSVNPGGSICAVRSLALAARHFKGRECGATVGKG